MIHNDTPSVIDFLARLDAIQGKAENQVRKEAKAIAARNSARGLLRSGATLKAFSDLIESECLVALGDILETLRHIKSVPGIDYLACRNHALSRGHELIPALRRACELDKWIQQIGRGNAGEVINKGISALLPKIDYHFRQFDVGLDLIGVARSGVALLAPILPTSISDTRRNQPSPLRKWYVSYAWKDDDDPDRETPVDELCAEAESLGICIHRDRTNLKRSDCITTFMDEIASGDRIIVFLSQKYLKSLNCMYELYAVWQNSKSANEFINKLRLWVLPDTKIWTPNDRITWSRYWRNEYEKLERSIGPDEPKTLLGVNGMEMLLRMQRFYTETDKILATIANHIHHRDWRDFVRDALNDE